MADHFKGKAETFDASEQVQLLSKAVGKAMNQHLALDGKKVLDFGAGTGLVCSHIAPRVASITAVDISESMLSVLVEKEALKQCVTPKCHDLLAEPLDERFELIVSAMAMHHVEDTKRLLERFYEHLDVGGEIAIADLYCEDGNFHKPGTQGVFHLGFDDEALTTLALEVGFNEVNFKTVHAVEKPNGSYPIFLFQAKKLNS